MKCRKGDRVLLADGIWHKVTKGTNKENGYFEMYETFHYPTGRWTQITMHKAAEIVDVKKRR